jgi:hypothetical protein
MMPELVGLLIGIFVIGPFVCFLISYLPTKLAGGCGTCQAYKNQDWCGAGVCQNQTSGRCGVVNSDTCRQWVAR